MPKPFSVINILEIMEIGQEDFDDGYKRLEKYQFRYLDIFLLRQGHRLLVLMEYYDCNKKI